MNPPENVEQKPRIGSYRFSTVENTRSHQILSKAVSILPEDVLDYFRKNPILFSGETDEQPIDAVRFTDEYKKHRYIVHFHSRLWKYTDDEIILCILTQIAHCYLGNQSGFWSWEKHKDPITKQESEAEKLVHQWMQRYVQKVFGLNEDCNIIINIHSAPDIHPLSPYG